MGYFPANPFGLFDMAGNVWNFTQDCWHANYDGAPGDSSARINPKCDERVVRGGSALTGLRRKEIGFLVVRDLNVR